MLPAVAPSDATIARFREALLVEDDEDVRRSMVEGLVALATPNATSALWDLLRDSKAPVPVRVQIATHLSASGVPAEREALREAAASAPPALAAGIRAALSAPEATETGFLVTGFVGGQERSGPLEVGDLVLSYDGRSAADELDAAVRGALHREGPVRVVVSRAGARHVVEVAPGWLGLIGRVVRSRDRR
jgi:hypothetical protein